MKLKIHSEKINPLLKRREIIFEIEHQQTGSTPTRLEVRKVLADVLKTEIEKIYVKKIETKKGTLIAMGTAHAYDNLDAAKLAEPKYIIQRNLPQEKKSEETQEKSKE
jgi:ribosomal protein S24E